MTKTIRIEDSKYTIQYDPEKPWAYSVFKSNQYDGDSTGLNILNDLIFHLIESIEAGIVLKGITVE